MRTAGAMTFALLVFVAACGGDDDDEDGATTASAGDGGDDCTFLSTARAEDAIGGTLELQRSDDTGCGWTVEGDDGSSLAFTLDRIPIQIDVDEYIAGSTDFCDEGTVTEVDAGDAAHACVAIGSPTATVFHGDDAYALAVVGADEADAEDLAASLAELLAAISPG